MSGQKRDGESYKIFEYENDAIKSNFRKTYLAGL